MDGKGAILKMVDRDEEPSSVLLTEEDYFDAVGRGRCVPAPKDMATSVKLFVVRTSEGSRFPAIQAVIAQEGKEDHYQSLCCRCYLFGDDVHVLMEGKYPLCSNCGDLQYFLYESRQAKKNGKTYHLHFSTTVKVSTKNRNVIEERANWKFGKDFEAELNKWNNDEANETKFLPVEFKRVKFGCSTDEQKANDEMDIILGAAMTKAAFGGKVVCMQTGLLPKKPFGQEAMLPHGIRFVEAKEPPVLPTGLRSLSHGQLPKEGEIGFFVEKQPHGPPKVMRVDHTGKVTPSPMTIEKALAAMKDGGEEWEEDFRKMFRLIWGVNVEMDGKMFK